MADALKGTESYWRDIIDIAEIIYFYQIVAN